MADYSSKSDYDFRDTPQYKEAQSRKDELLQWWGTQGYRPDGSKDCPRCGASVRWDFIDATNAFLHMDFHYRWSKW